MNAQKYPKRIIFDLTNKCNLKCLFCARTVYDYEYQYLPFSLFEKAKEIFPYTEEVTLLGWGEPLCHPEFEKIFQVCASYKNMKTYIISNGLILDRFAQTFVDNNLTYLALSIDGATKEIYEKLRKGSNFKKVIENIRLINKLKDDKKSLSPYMRFVFVAAKENIKELPALVKLAKDKNIPEIKVVYLTVYKPEFKDSSLWFYRDMVEDVFNEAGSVAKRLKIKLNLPPVIGKDPLKDVFHAPCDVAFNELYIGCDGKIRRCQAGAEELSRFTGNESFADIWNSDFFKDFRKTVNTDSPPDDCCNCSQSNRLNVNRHSAHFKFQNGIPLTLRSK